MLSNNRLRIINTLGADRRFKVWDALCDTFHDSFRTKDAIGIVMQELSLTRKASQDYWDALRAFWLEPGNSDLVPIRRGLYGWKRHD